MTLSEIEALLRRTMGLDAASISSTMVERAVRKRLQSCGLDWEAYGQQLRDSAEELHELIEGVVVPETWFFRDREAFGLLARLAVEEWSRKPPHELIRLLSLPCSTGEEPYSMAMALLDVGIPPGRFHIDAVDISRVSLASARKGRYGRNSFRGDDLTFRGRHFMAEGRAWALAEAVDREGQAAVVEALGRRLAADGLLFVGPSEASLASERGFVPVRVPQTFAFRKGKASQAKQPWNALPVLPPIAKAARPVASPRPVPFAVIPPSSPSVPLSTGPVSGDDGLGEVRKLADQGKLAEAIALGETRLRTHGPSVPLFHLLGVVHDALRNPREAIAFYRKALYLAPDHREVLAQLASLLESQGDKAGARVLQERARRLAAKQT